MVERWTRTPLVRALQAMGGIDLITVVVLAAEIGDFKRFRTPKQLMAYLGLVPSEHSSGGTRRQGGITLTGNRHTRWVLVEAAWNYRFRPGASLQLTRVDNGCGRSAGIAQCAERNRYTSCRLAHLNASAAELHEIGDFQRNCCAPRAEVDYDIGRCLAFMRCLRMKPFQSRHFTSGFTIDGVGTCSSPKALLHWGCPHCS